MTVNCSVCKEVICKYEKDFRSSGGLQVAVGKELKHIAVCTPCAKVIAEELIHEA